MPKCSTPYCQNEAANHKKKCYRCKQRAYKKRHPLAYSYNTLKQNAKRRQIHFELTIEDFKRFCYETDYLRGKGKTSKSLTIDRIDPALGYNLNNIQVLTNSANVAKNMTLERFYEYDTKRMRFYVRKNYHTHDPHCPF